MPNKTIGEVYKEFTDEQRDAIHYRIGGVLLAEDVDDDPKYNKIVEDIYGFFNSEQLLVADFLLDAAYKERQKCLLEANKKARASIDPRFRERMRRNGL